MAWMLAIALSVLPMDGPLKAPMPARSADEWRAAYTEALQNSARKADPDPFAVVPSLLSLYRQLSEDESLSHAERSRMQRGLKSRLETLRDRVLRDAMALKREQDRMAYRAEREGFKLRGEQLAGGEIANAVQLVELIQNAIAPESWDVNGGNGSIRYFSLLKVLVVRQTGEVHHQVGGALSQLKK